MRKGYPDSRIAASPRTAFHNVRLFLEFNEFPRSSITRSVCRAALEIAGDLERVCLKHANERQTGLKAY
jgi:hypothetical protein